MISSSDSSSVSVTSDLPSRLIRFEVDSIESGIRPFRFSFARSSSPGRRCPRRCRRAARGDLEALDEVLLTRPDVEPEQAGVGVLGGEAVDRVRHPALLPDLLEEARRRRPAEDRVEQRGGEAPLVRARCRVRRDRRGTARCPCAGSARPEPQLGSGLRARRRGRLGLRQPREALEHALVLEIPGRRDDDVVRAYSGAVVALSARRPTDEITSARPITGRPSG